MDLLSWTIWTGIGATATMDLWTLARRRLFGVAVPDYALVGRWLAHMRHRRFRHASIARATPVRHEATIGWTAHYAIGVSYAALLPALWGAGWFQAPAPGPALAVGLGTVLAPFLLMQPGMGAGFAASRTPRPALARLHTLLNHGVFGLGLYLAACAAQFTQGVP